MNSSARNLYSKEKKNPFQIPLKYWHYLISEFLIILDSSLILFVSDLSMVFSYISYCSFPIPSTLSKEQGINRIMRVQPFSWYKWHMISNSVHLQHFSFLFFPKLGAIALFLLEKVYWGRSQDGGGIGQGDHFLFYKFIERTTERWTEFTKQLLIASSGHQAPRKAAHCLRREVGQKY